jgi:hypothetical protein
MAPASEKRAFPKLAIWFMRGGGVGLIEQVLQLIVG